MNNRYVFIEDLHAGDIGMDFEMGLLFPKGAIVDNLLPGMDELLLLRKKIIPESDWWKLQAEAEKQKANEVQQQAEAGKAKSAPENKRGRGARSNKAR